MSISLRTLKGVGEKTEKLFAKIGVTDMESLLSYYPRNYDAYEEPVEIRSLEEGAVVAISVAVITGVYVNPCTCNLSSIRCIYVSMYELCGNCADQTCTGKSDHSHMAPDNSNELSDGILLADFLCRTIRKIYFRKAFSGERKGSSFCRIKNM